MPMLKAEYLLRVNPLEVKKLMSRGLSTARCLEAQPLHKSPCLVLRSRLSRVTQNTSNFQTVEIRILCLCSLPVLWLEPQETEFAIRYLVVICPYCASPRQQ